VFLFVVLCLSVVEQPALERPDGDEGNQHQRRGEYPNPHVAETDHHAHRRYYPDRGRGGQSPDLNALPEDGPGAEETNAGHDLRGDTGWISLVSENRLRANGREEARAHSDQRHRADAGRVTMPLALGTDDDREDEGDDDAKGEIQIAANWQRL
jgi:hypothetical protein